MRGRYHRILDAPFSKAALGVHRRCLRYRLARRAIVAVPPENWAQGLASLADAVERYLADGEYARKMGHAARQSALKMLDPKALNQHERSKYLELLG